MFIHMTEFVDSFFKRFKRKLVMTVIINIGNLDQEK